MKNELDDLTITQKTTFIKAITQLIDVAINAFLSALKEIGEIQIAVDGQNFVDLNDEIHGEAYSEEGSIAKYSKRKTNS